MPKAAVANRPPVDIAVVRSLIFRNSDHKPDHTSRMSVMSLTRGAGSGDAAAATGDPDECTDECEAALDCHMRRFMTSIDAAAQAQGQSFAAIKVSWVWFTDGFAIAVRVGCVRLVIAVHASRCHCRAALYGR